MSENLRVLGAVSTSAKMKEIIDDLHQCGYTKDDIKLVANRRLDRELRKEASVYEQDDIDPTDDNILNPNETNGIFLHFNTIEELKKEYRDTHNEREGSWWDRLIDAFQYGNYLTEDQEMLIRDYQEQLTRGQIIVLVKDDNIPPEKRYFLS